MNAGSDLVTALVGAGGAAPRPGVLHVVAVPRFDPGTTSLRAAVVVAGADVLRVPATLPPDVLAGLSPTAERVAGDLPRWEPTTDELAGRVVVQLVPAAAQTAPATVHHVGRLRDLGHVVEVVASTGTVESALVAGGLGVGVARRADDGRLDVAVLAADRPDLKEWRDGLVRRGYLGHTPVKLVVAAGTPRQQVRVRQVIDLPDEQVPHGTVVAVVGDEVTGPVDHRADLPLRGVRVLNPRAPHQAAPLSAHVRSLGGIPVEAPLIDTAPGDLGALDDAVADLASGMYEAVCLTSPNGADALADAVERTGHDARVLATPRLVACVGPGTAARLRERLRVDADVVPGTSTTEALAAAVGAPRAGARALLPRADLASDVLRDGLAAAGWQPQEVVAYRTTTTEAFTPELTEALAAGQVPVVPVLSSSMASALVAIGRRAGVRAAIVSIGPVTSATLREGGVEPLLEATSHDLMGLVDAIADVGSRLPERDRVD